VKKKQTKTKRTKRTTRTKKPAPKRAKKRSRKIAGLAKWSQLVAKRGVMLASARGPVPSIAEAVAGEPIVGSWWSHPKAHAIFAALSAIDDDEAIKCFRLVDKKITFVHRRLWPALARLAQAGVLAPDRVAAIKQEHMPTGEHRNFTISFPDWVPADVLAAAGTLSVEDARSQLGDWV